MAYRSSGDLTSPDEGFAKTCDLYLASFLVTAGCKTVKNQTDNRRVYFYFDNKDGMVDRLKTDYMTRNAMVNALSYADNVKALKSLCAELMNNSRR